MLKKGNKINQYEIVETDGYRAIVRDSMFQSVYFVISSSDNTNLLEICNYQMPAFPKPINGFEYEGAVYIVYKFMQGDILKKGPYDVDFAVKVAYKLCISTETIWKLSDRRFNPEIEYEDLYFISTGDVIVEEAYNFQKYVECSEAELCRRIVSILYQMLTGFKDVMSIRTMDPSFSYTLNSTILLCLNNRQDFELSELARILLQYKETDLLVYQQDKGKRPKGKGEINRILPMIEEYHFHDIIRFGQINVLKNQEPEDKVQGESEKNESKPEIVETNDAGDTKHPEETLMTDVSEWCPPKEMHVREDPGNYKSKKVEEFDAGYNPEEDQRGPSTTAAKESYHKAEAEKQQKSFIKKISFVRNISFKVRLSVVIGIVLFAGVGGFMFQKQQKVRKYQTYIDVVSRSTDSKEKVSLLHKAIDLIPDDTEAYEKLLGVYLEDAVFSSAEEKAYLKTIHKNWENIKECSTYGQLSYHIGKAYWYYYAYDQKSDEEITRMKSAVPWFSDCLKYKNTSKYHKVAKVYCEIGKFNQEITLNVKEGTDKGVYKKYFTNIAQLLEIGNSNTVASLELYKLAINSIDTYKQRFLDDGVTMEELNRVRQDTLYKVLNITPVTEKERELKKIIIGK